MKIMKYFFVLLVLALFALTVFIATQKGNFDVERTMLIKSPKSTVFNYVNDFRNWESFGSWKKEDPEMKFYYPNTTVGKGASYSWKGKNSEGIIKTISVSLNEKIQQNMVSNGTNSTVYWTFKDTLGGTKVNWRSKGSMSFSFKVYSVFKGGVDKVIGNMYEKSLTNLDRTLDYEMNTYSIKVKGQVQKLGGYYLQQTITSTIANVPKNLRIMIPNMIYFFKKNNIAMTGKPFVLYRTYDVANGITKLSVCVPVKEEIFTSPGSDITSGKLLPFQAVKTTLTGDYSHSKKAWDKAFEYISKNNLTQNTEGSYLEIYSKSIEDIANPSKWITEIYIPVKAKVAAVPFYKPKAILKTEPSLPVPAEVVAP